MRFTAGMSGEFSGVEWRVVEGKKGPGDLRMEIRTSGWIPISMAVSMVQADFYAQNEETLQKTGRIGRTAGQPAGARFIHFCEGAQLLGWETAVDQLRIEREAAKKRRDP